MGSIFPGCEDSVHNLNPNAKVCSEQHCDNFTESQTFHDDCNTFGKGHPLYPVSTAQCINKNPPHDIKEPDYDPTWGYSCPDGYATQTCYCCCSCLANGTRIAIPDGTRVIEQFHVGDAVTVGNWEAQQLSWSTGTVKFSSGTDSGWASTMIFIQYTGDRRLIASPDHLFLMANGKLKRADRLVPGKDQLMSAEGTALDIYFVQSGKWSGGLHHIATDLKFNGSLNGHLINSAGVVSGDYCLQVNQYELVKMGLMDGPDDTPVLGSESFAAANPHLTVTRAAAVPTSANLGALAAPKGFSAFNPEEGIYIPAGAAQFLTDDQADDIVKNKLASFRDLTSESGVDAVNYLIKVFKAFYPSINILIDRANPKFNTWAFEMYGQQHLVISGEITRLNGLYADGYKFILAQGIARLLGATPNDPDGFTYTAAADFYALSSIFRNVFFLDSDDLFNNALDQIKTVFGFILPAHAGGDENNLANDPSIKCRIGSINTGIFGGDVLPCACNDLVLLGATPDSTDPKNLLLELSFNKDIDPLSIEDLYNFKFTPADAKEIVTKLPQVLSATLDALDTSRVVLAVTSPLDRAFTITLTDVSSKSGSVLGDQHSATFTFATVK